MASCHTFDRGTHPCSLACNLPASADAQGLVLLQAAPSGWQGYQVHTCAPCASGVVGCGGAAGARAGPLDATSVRGVAGQGDHGGASSVDVDAVASDAAAATAAHVTHDAEADGAQGHREPLACVQYEDDAAGACLIHAWQLHTGLQLGVEVV